MRNVGSTFITFEEGWAMVSQNFSCDTIPANRLNDSIDMGALLFGLWSNSLFSRMVSLEWSREGHVTCLF
jgi:hypothetical protein